MEDKKKKALNEEELDKVTGGNGTGTGNDEEKYYPYPCTKYDGNGCGRRFKTEAERDAHMETCAYGSLAPEISPDLFG